MFAMKDKKAVIINKASMKGMPNQLTLESQNAIQTKEYPSSLSCLPLFPYERSRIIAAMKSGTGLKTAARGFAMLGLTKTGSSRKINAPANMRIDEGDILFMLFYQ
jgi:hypothetical protein